MAKPKILQEEQHQNKPQNIDITLFSADNILKSLQILGIFACILGFVLFANPYFMGYGFVLIFVASPIWTITTLLRGGMRKGLGFLLEVRVLDILILYLMIMGIVFFIGSLWSFDRTYALWVTFSVAFFDMFVILTMISWILHRLYNDVIKGKKELGQTDNLTIIEAAREDITELFRTIFFIGLIVPLLSAGNTIVIYAGLFLILVGSLASVFVPLFLEFLRIDVSIKIKFLKIAVRETFLVAVGLLIIIGTLVNIPDLSTTAPADGKMAFIIIGLAILFLGTLMSSASKFKDIAKHMEQEIDKERHRKFLEKLRLDRQK